MKNPFEKLWKTTEKPKLKEAPTQSPYRNSISEKERKLMQERDKQENDLWLGKIVRWLDRRNDEFSSPDLEIRLHALAGRLLEEELPAGSPLPEVLDSWLAKLKPIQKRTLISLAIQKESGWYKIYKEKYGTIFQELAEEEKPGKKKYRGGRFD